MSDLIVVGAGGCGLMAALVAARSGADVIVLEKTRDWGGGTALSHPALRGAGTRFQQEAGIDDTPSNYAAEILQRNGNVDADLVMALTGISGRMIEFIADVATLDFRLDAFTFGQSAARSHKWSSDEPITDFLFAAAREEHRIEIRFATPVSSLISEDDAVVGVVADNEAILGRSVLLASGGFGASRTMLERYIPYAADVAFPGHQGSTGEGIEMGRALGAAVRHMDSFQPYPAHVGPGKRGVPPGVILSGGIVVDEKGSRFIDETQYPGGLARAMLQLSAPHAFEIFDQTIFEAHGTERAERSVEEMYRSGELRSADSAAGLALELGVDSDRLEDTLADYAYAAGGNDSFGRRVEKMLEPPLYGIPIRVALYHTQGGLAVDPHGRVLREDGSVIRNLYAGGGAAAGVSGDGMDGYLPGNGLLASLGLGMIAAQHAVSSRREESSADS